MPRVPVGPGLFPPEQRAHVVAIASEATSEHACPATRWSLDDLAARFIAHGWSLKWLHREIMLSSTYQQANRVRADALQADGGNVLLWRMSPRRMDAESYRDSLLRAAGLLKQDMYGPPEDTADAANGRRTIYNRVSRARAASVFLSHYDFPDPMLTSPARQQTTTSIQQLFVLNSQFMHDLSRAVATSPAPKCQPHTRLTMTLAAKACESEKILRANSSRPEP